MPTEEETLLKFYSSPLSDKFKNLAKPLEDCFQLNSFCYVITTTSGQCLHFSNQPDANIAFLSKKVYIKSPFMRHPDNYFENQVLLTADLKNIPAYKAYNQSKKVFKKQTGLDDNLCIYRKEKGKAHMFAFASNIKGLPLNTIFLNNLFLLQSFTDYFFKEWQKYAPLMEEFMIDFGETMGPAYFDIDTNLSLKRDKSKLKEFLLKIGLINGMVDTDFPDRELDCIEHFLKGKPIRKIAESLRISPRTAEHYIDNVKLRTNCFSRSELFEILQVFKESHLLS